MSTMRALDAVAVLPSTALPDLPPVRLDVRQRRLASAVIGSLAALVAITVGAAALLQAGVRGPSWIALLGAAWIGGFAALFAWLYLRDARTARGPGGWVLREDDAHLLVNLRSHLNVHFDPATPSVLVLPRRRVQSLTVVRERGVRTHVGARGAIFETPIRREFLDIAFDGDTEAVAAALAAERARWGPAVLGRSRSGHSAVRLLPDGALRIAWRDETNRLRPGLSPLARQWRPRYRLVEAEPAEQAPLRALDRAGQEARRLDMVARGERVEAIALAKALYGMDTTEAVRFVDGLVR